MKRFPLAFVSATWLLFGAPTMAADLPAKDQIATAKSLTKPQAEPSATVKQKKQPGKTDTVHSGGPQAG